MKIKQGGKKIYFKYGLRGLGMAGEEGIEPSHTDPESAVLPLDDSPVQINYS
jgi:hypothetical protein